MDYFFGFGSGFAVALFIATILTRMDHEAWCRIVDRQQAVLEKMAARLTRPDDQADWWKQN